jgi:hypothetical protein
VKRSRLMTCEKVYASIFLSLEGRGQGEGPGRSDTLEAFAK